MGRDKARLAVDGTALATRVADLARRVVSLAVEVGGGVTGLPFVTESTPGAGPLVAVAAGVEELRHRGHAGGALVLACDLPLLNADLLWLLATWPSEGSVVPVVAGYLQVLCARWSVADLDDARARAARGERSLRHLAARRDVTLLHDDAWRSVATAATFTDVDTPDDLRRLGWEVT